MCSQLNMHIIWDLIKHMGMKSLMFSHMSSTMMTTWTGSLAGLISLRTIPFTEKNMINTKTTTGSNWLIHTSFNLACNHTLKHHSFNFYNPDCSMYIH